MTDLEMTRLCAESLGWKHLGPIGYLPKEDETYKEIERNAGEKPWCKSGANDWWIDPEGHTVCGPCSMSYDPMHDDAQAMALVKKFWLELFVVGKEQGRQWAVGCHDCGDTAIEWDLNRAICEAVSKMQAAKK